MAMPTQGLEEKDCTPEEWEMFFRLDEGMCVSKQRQSVPLIIYTQWN